MPNFLGLLLSPRSKKTQQSYVTCSACCNSIQCSNEKKINPPKYAITNGFVIGSFPKVITFVNKDGNEEKRDVDAEVDISDVLRAYMAPIRPFGCIYVFTGGSHKWVRGNY